MVEDQPRFHTLLTNISWIEGEKGKNPKVNLFNYCNYYNKNKYQYCKKNSCKAYKYLSPIWNYISNLIQTKNNQTIHWKWKTRPKASIYFLLSKSNRFNCVRDQKFKTELSFRLKSEKFWRIQIELVKNYNREFILYELPKFHNYRFGGYCTYLCLASCHLFPFL